MEHLMPFFCFILGIIFASISVWAIFPQYIVRLWDKTKKDLK